MTDEEFNEWIGADDGLETMKETTDDEILERVMLEMHGNDVDVDKDDEDDEEISVSDLEAKSAIVTLKKYLRQKEDCTSDIGSMKLGKIDLFVNSLHSFWHLINTGFHSRVVNILNWSKRLECFAKKDPGRARQSS